MLPTYPNSIEPYRTYLCQTSGHLPSNKMRLSSSPKDCGMNISNIVRRASQSNGDGNEDKEDEEQEGLTNAKNRVADSLMSHVKGYCFQTFSKHLEAPSHAKQNCSPSPTYFIQKGVFLTGCGCNKNKDITKNCEVLILWCRGTCSKESIA